MTHAKDTPVRAFNLSAYPVLFFSISDDLILLARHTVPKKQNPFLG